MSLTDWIVLGATILLIVVYGLWKSGNNKNIDQFLVGGRSLSWYHIGFSVMATQASAITFLSAPGRLIAMGCDLYSFTSGCRWR
ncbi:hypothetical protein [Mucilaginibacter humi]|uniref:hypothetical protein n=1 Tax=Mucilaginibacter humi TaxID=2732510 RepID=UPI003742D6B9